MAIRDFQGKLVLVTGAASGIGRATALAFARQGARIAACDVAEPALADLRAEIERLGGSCSTHVVDVSSEAAVCGLAEAVVSREGAPHVLVNNAGVGYLGLFLGSDLAHWAKVLGVNVMGVVHGCRHFLPPMIAAGGPRHVLNVSSSAGNYPLPSMAAYAASKAAVFGFSEVLKMELDRTSVRVTTVCPGVIDTPIVRGTGNVAASVPAAQVESLQEYYRREGASPDVVAGDMVRAVRDDVDLLLTGPGARLMYHLRRVSLRLVRSFVLRFARRSGYLD